MNKLISIVLLLAILIGCQRTDELSSGNNNNLYEIQLSTYVNTATRASALNNSSFNTEGQNFQLYATSIDNNNSLYTIGYTTVYNIDGEWVAGQYSDGTWVDAQTMYWPTSASTVDFHAWSPSELKQITYGAVELDTPTNEEFFVKCDTRAANYTGAEADPTITFYKQDNDALTLDDDGSTPSTQDDIIYALQINEKNPTQESVDGEIPNSQITLNFSHIYTLLKFKIATQSGIQVRIKAMTLHNVISQMSYHDYYDTDGTRIKEWYGWDPYGSSDLPNYHCVPMSWADATSSDFFTSTIDNPTMEIQSNNDLMVIPQTITAWKPTIDGYNYPISRNDGLSGSYAEKWAYLRIYCDITLVVDKADGTTIDVPLFGDNITPSGDSSFEMPADYCIYVPISSADANGNEVWEAGNQVNYLLTFGGGYDKDGNTVLNPIKLTPTVYSWDYVN